MEPIHSIAYYLELQRHLSAGKESWREPLVGDQKEVKLLRHQAKPDKRIKVGVTDIALAILSFAALVTSGLVCFLFPTFLT
ncbi:MAG TPA: hypothetical protein VN939_20535 [Chthoniobacterales bacterium]|jgi:hypothetical protein|nr:hypothetical protein [Chthoniobacterales bacterium]